MLVQRSDTVVIASLSTFFFVFKGHCLTVILFICTHAPEYILLCTHITLQILTCVVYLLQGNVTSALKFFIFSQSLCGDLVLRRNHFHGHITTFFCPRRHLLPCWPQISVHSISTGTFVQTVIALDENMGNLHILNSFGELFVCTSSTIRAMWFKAHKQWWHHYWLLIRTNYNYNGKMPSTAAISATLLTLFWWVAFSFGDILFKRPCTHS